MFYPGDLIAAWSQDFGLWSQIGLAREFRSSVVDVERVCVITAGVSFGGWKEAVKIENERYDCGKSPHNASTLQSAVESLKSRKPFRCLGVQSTQQKLCGKHPVDKTLSGPT